MTTILLSPLVSQTRGFEAKSGWSLDRTNRSAARGEIGNSRNATRPQKPWTRLSLNSLRNSPPRCHGFDRRKHSYARECSRRIHRSKPTWLAEGSGDKLPGSPCTKPARLKQRLQHTRRIASRVKIPSSSRISAAVFMSRNYRFNARANRDTMHSRKNRQIDGSFAISSDRITIRISWRLDSNFFFFWRTFDIFFADPEFV